MRKVILFFIGALTLVSCQKNSYTIKGTIADANYEGKNVYIQQLGENEMVTIDSVVVKNGSFTVKGAADSTFLRFIALDESVAKNVKGTPVFIEPGTIEVKIDSVATVSGTPVNNAYNAYTTTFADLNKKGRALFEEYNKAKNEGTLTDALEEEIGNKFDKINDEMKALGFAFVKENITNEMGEYIFLTSANMFEPEQQKEILGLASDKFKAKEPIKHLITLIENEEKVSEGKKFVDFTMQDPSGKDVSLSDYAGKGKYVFIDFWASWCGPCRNEMPNVVAAYNKYKNKGFEVVGVSLDRDKDAWVKGIKDLNMTWPQMSDLKFWESPVVELYAFRGIPHTVLLDKEGVIIAKNLRGKELDDKLAELMP